MDFQHMFRALVVGSGLSAAGCVGKESPSTNPGDAQVGTTPSAAEADEGAAPVRSTGEADDGTVDCEEICDYAMEPICPDPKTGAEGCCWLMLEPHPCCDYEPPVKEDHGQEG